MCQFLLAAVVAAGFSRVSPQSASSRNAVTRNMFQPSASALFDSGVRFGIMCMMAGKSEINELSKTMEKMAKIVEELKSELIIRKSPHAHQVLDYVGNIGMEDDMMLKKTENELRDTDAKFWSLPVIDNDECESSALTSDPLVLEMDKLEAELEFELQKLPGHTLTRIAMKK